MYPDRAHLIEETLEAWQQLIQEMQRGAAPDWLQLELTMAQLKALMAIARDGSLTISSLAESLGVGLSAASQITERLVQQQLVERWEDPANRRRTLVRLSSTGQRLVASLREGGRERLRDWLSRMEDDDLVALVRGLRALARDSDREPSDAGNPDRQP